MFFQQDILSLVFREIGDLGYDEQLLDERQSLLLALIHDVLLSPSSQYPLQEEDGHLPLDAILGGIGLALEFSLGDAGLSFD
jgi:hypothetical protein